MLFMLGPRALETSVMSWPTLAMKTTNDPFLGREFWTPPTLGPRMLETLIMSWANEAGTRHRIALLGPKMLEALSMSEQNVILLLSMSWLIVGMAPHRRPMLRPRTNTH